METLFKIVPNYGCSCDYFSLAGNIDAQAETLLKELPAKIQQPVVKLDFSHTGRINSMGIALLLRCFRRIRDEKQAEIQLLEVNPMNTMLFKMTGIFLLATPAKA